MMGEGIVAPAGAERGAEPVRNDRGAEEGISRGIAAR